MRYCHSEVISNELNKAPKEGKGYKYNVHCNIILSLVLKGFPL